MSLIFQTCRNYPFFLCCLHHSVLHHPHEPSHWFGCKWHQDPDGERQQRIYHQTNYAGQWYDGPEVNDYLQILCPWIHKTTIWGVTSLRRGMNLFNGTSFSGFWVNMKTSGSWHSVSMIQRTEIWKNGFMIIVSGKAFYFNIKFPCKIHLYAEKKKQKDLKGWKKKPKEWKKKPEESKLSWRNWRTSWKRQSSRIPSNIPNPNPESQFGSLRPLINQGSLDKIRFRIFSDISSSKFNKSAFKFNKSALKNLPLNFSNLPLKI